MNKSTAHFYLAYLFAFLLFPLSLSAQNAGDNNGKVAGQIIDAETGQAIIGANILVQGTQRGAATDIDGYYSIKNMSPGTYDIRVSYVSYGRKVITGVRVSADKITTLSTSLKPTSQALKGVTVTAGANRNSEVGLLITRKKAPSVIDGISSEQMGKIGDKNVGEAMKRVTGVTVENGKNIYVRGLGNRYSNIQLDGSQVPSTDPNKKEVPTDLVGSGLVQNVLVQKTYTVDQMGEFSGGSVKINTKEFPYERHLTVSYSTSYNTVSTLESTLSGVGGNTDFLGFDNGSRSLPSVLKNERVNDDNAGTVAHGLNNHWDLNKNRQSIPSQSIGISYANQFNQDKMPIGVVSNFSYKYNRKFEPHKTERFLQGYNSNKGPGEQAFLTNYKKDYGIQVANLSGLLNLFIKPTSKTKFGLKNLYSNSLQNYATVVQGKYLNGITRQTVSDFDRRSILSSTLMGESYFENFLSSKLSGHISYNRATHNHPDRRTTRYNKVSNTGDQQYQFQQFGDNNAHYFSSQEDNNYAGEIKYEIKPFDFLDISTGGNIMMKDRSFKARRISYRDQVAPFLPQDLKFQPPSVVLNDENVQGTGGNGYLELTETTQFNRDWYRGHQTIYAGYLNTDWQPLDKLSVGLGLRMEQSKQTIKVPESISGDYHQVAKLDNMDFLPAVNITYALTTKTNIRAAYSKTLARPSFREISNFSFADYQGGRRIYGNPDLRQTNISNYDLRFETYPSGGQVFSAGLFYKHFKNPIELYYRLVDANEVFYNNAPEANLYGVEVEGRQNITDRLKLVANATYIYSQSRSDSSASSRVANLKRPLNGQSPYIINLSTFYTIPNWHLTTSLSFNSYGKRIVTVGKNAQKFDEYEQPFNALGAKIEYALGRYDVSLEANNLFNDTHTYKQGPVTTFKYKPGVDFKLGVTLKL